VTAWQDNQTVVPAVLSAVAASGLNTLDGAFAYRDGQDLDKPGLGHRRRTELTLSDAQGKSHRLFLKRYQAEPLAWRIRRLLTYGRARSVALVEADNIRLANQAGIATMQAVCAGQAMDGFFPGRSYIIVTAVPGDAMSRRLDDFISRHDSDALAEQLVEKLAGLVGRFHQADFVHRDLYTSHIFMDETPDGLELNLIDLARMFQPKWRAFRWRVKDLAQLKFSLPAQWCRRHWEKFLELYFSQAGLSPGQQRRYRQAIDRKAQRLFARDSLQEIKKAGQGS
jgi:tRNA A-37 threonylcarbamoyl transferase component Bud32